MRRLSFVGTVSVVLAGLIAACSNPRSTNPMSPATPTVSSLQLIGPSSIPPGASAQFVADVRLSTGVTKSSASPTTSVRWRSSNTAVVQVNGSGFATAGATLGDTVITAEVPPTNNPRGTLEVVVVPDGTFRVTGTVREADSNLGITGARVEVPGTSIVATTTGGGFYRLFGVPPVAELRVTAPGYQAVTQNVQINEHATYNFFMGLSGPRLALNGSYRVSIDFVGPCGGTRPLPTDLLHRTYEASVTTTGSTIDVRLTEPRFVISFGEGNRFFGVADPAGARFFLTDWYYYYPSIAERLPDDSVLIPYGSATTVAASGGVSGTLAGGIYSYDSRFPSFNAAYLGGCFSNNIQFAMTPR